MTTILINILAFATLLSGVFSITSKNPVISVVFLIGTFVLSAGYLILIGINFVGISYIIVYVGAIAVLFLFVIMMLNIRIIELKENLIKYVPLTLILGFILFFELIYIFYFVLNKDFTSTIELNDLFFFNFTN